MFFLRKVQILIGEEGEINFFRTLRFPLCQHYVYLEVNEKECLVRYGVASDSGREITEVKESSVR